MPKVMRKRLQTNKPYKRIDLEPSKAWIRNLGIGTTRVMPKHKWMHAKTVKTVNETQFKSVATIQRPKHLTHFECDVNANVYKLPELKREVNDYFDETITKFPDKYCCLHMDSVNKNVHLFPPVRKQSENLATFDSSPPSLDSYSGHNKSNNDDLSSLPSSSSASFKKMDEASRNTCNMDLIDGKRSKIKYFRSSLTNIFIFRIVSLQSK